VKVIGLQARSCCTNYHSERSEESLVILRRSSTEISRDVSLRYMTALFPLVRRAPLAFH